MSGQAGLSSQHAAKVLLIEPNTVWRSYWIIAMRRSGSCLALGMEIVLDIARQFHAGPLFSTLSALFTFLLEGSSPQEQSLY